MKFHLYTLAVCFMAPVAQAWDFFYTLETDGSKCKSEEAIQAIRTTLDVCMYGAGARGFAVHGDLANPGEFAAELRKGRMLQEDERELQNVCSGCNSSGCGSEYCQAQCSGCRRRLFGHSSFHAAPCKAMNKIQAECLQAFKDLASDFECLGDADKITFTIDFPACQ